MVFIKYFHFQWKLFDNVDILKLKIENLVR